MAQSAINRRREFGIREITSDLNSVGGRAFHINGKNILIRGGGWTPDMMLRENSQRLHDEFRYVKDMGLNTVRLEGKLETQEFFDLADQRRNSGDGGMVLLRFLGALAAVAAEGFRYREAVAARSDLPAAQPSQPRHVAERQRQSSAARCRADVPRCRKRPVLAEPGSFVSDGKEDQRDRR